MKRYYLCLLYCILFSIAGLAQSEVEESLVLNPEEISMKEEMSDLEKKIISLEQKINMYENRARFHNESQKDRHNELDKRFESTKQDLSSKYGWINFITSFLLAFIILLGIIIPWASYYFGKKFYKDVEEQRKKTSGYLDEINKHIKSIKEKTKERKAIQEKLSALSSGNLTGGITRKVLNEIQEIMENSEITHFEENWAQALISYYNNNYFDALSKLNYLLEEFPSQIDLKTLTYIYANMMSCYYHKEKYNIALMYCDSIISLDPVNETAYSNKGVILSKFKDKQEEALENFEKAIEINPYDSLFWTNKGNILMALDKYTEAMEIFDAALKIDSMDYLAWSNKGIILSKNMGHHEEAINCFDKAIEINENYLLALVHKGDILTLLERHKEAIACFDKILEKDPTNEIVKECRKDLLNIVGQSQA